MTITNPIPNPFNSTTQSRSSCFMIAPLHCVFSHLPSLLTLSNQIDYSIHPLPQLICSLYDYSTSGSSSKPSPASVTLPKIRQHLQFHPTNQDDPGDFLRELFFRLYAIATGSANFNAPESQIDIETMPFFQSIRFIQSYSMQCNKEHKDFRQDFGMILNYHDHKSVMEGNLHWEPSFDNDRCCSTCKSKSLSYPTYSLTTSSHLIIQLYPTNNTKVLILHNTVTINGRPAKLTASVLRFGSLPNNISDHKAKTEVRSGHYICLLNDISNNQWIIIDDRCKPAPRPPDGKLQYSSQLSQSTPYMLFYEFTDVPINTGTTSNSNNNINGPNHNLNRKNSTPTNTSSAHNLGLHAVNNNSICNNTQVSIKNRLRSRSTNSRSNNSSRTRNGNVRSSSAKRYTTNQTCTAPPQYRTTPLLLPSYATTMDVDTSMTNESDKNRNDNSSTNNTINSKNNNPCV